MSGTTRATNPASDGVLLKGGNRFLLADPEGRIPPGTAYGLYLDDTRHLSGYRFEVDGKSLTAQAVASPDLHRARLEAASGDVRVRREWALAAPFLETVYLEQGAPRFLRLLLEADFQDIFEVRNVVAGGPRTPSVATAPHALTYAYEGRDDVRRWTRVSFHPPPEEVGAGGATWEVDGAGAGPVVTVKVETGAGPLPRLGGMVLADDLAASLAKEMAERAARWRPFGVADPRLDGWLHRAAGDAAELLIQAGDRRVPAAGLPWYATVFGRDSLIFALETVYVRPEISQDVLRFLAGHQGRATDPYREEEPGKILHELRRGELAGAGRIPHTPYYGSVDATPLFLCLLAEVHRWTGDRGFLRELYPAARRAFAHLRTVLDRSPSGFLDYVGGKPPGLRHQGWKDGAWGILRPDGSQPDPPIAPCEAQGYAYWGLRGLAAVARTLEDETTASDAERTAAALRDRFHDAFWLDGEGTCVLALEGEGDAVATVASNPGHLLATGILSAGRADRLATRLLEADLFSGWGVRTLSADAPHYDPLSYHNGSVWPHDTALVAWGLARSGAPSATLRLYQGLRDAAAGVPGFRLPELLSGRPRDEDADPERVPEACSYQAWSTGVPYLLLRALLGLEPEAESGVLRVTPYLPAASSPATIRNLRVGGSVVDLRVTGAERETEVQATHRRGPPLDVVVGPP